MNREYIEEIFLVANTVFCNGIYVKSKDGHPCGWDFISSEYFENSDDMFEQPIDECDISNGFGSYEYTDKTVEEIINIVGVDGWCYEISGVDSLK